MGRLAFHKGLEFLVESAKYQDDDVRYIIVGDGDMRKPLEQMAKSFGVDDKVILVGKVPFGKLPQYYAACDVFSLPSVNRLEAFGIVALEAMATGKPVVVSDIPGVMELVSGGVEGLHSRPMDAKHLADQIARILGDEALAKEMGRAGRKKVEEKFRWSKVTDKVEELYESMLKR